MTDNKRLVFTLARRGKRLKFWRDSFNKSGIGENVLRELNERLNTYALLLAKLARDTDPRDLSTTENRLTNLDRKLDDTFEDLRLRTSRLHCDFSTR